MNRFTEVIHDVNNDERGHAQAGVPALVAAIAAIALGIGVAADSDVVAIISGIVLGLGILGASLGEHVGVDYNIFGRIEKLEK